MAKEAKNAYSQKLNFKSFAQVWCESGQTKEFKKKKRKKELFYF